MLKRVTSRVSQWFSPTTNPNQSPNSENLPDPNVNLEDQDGDATSRGEFNGHQRRRCSDIISPDVNEGEESKVQPPLKRSKTTIVEVGWDLNNFFTQKQNT